MTACHGHARLDQPPDDERRGERPEAEEEVEQVERPAATGRVQVEDEPVGPAVDGAAAEAERDRRARNSSHVGTVASPTRPTR